MIRRIAPAPLALFSAVALTMAACAATPATSPTASPDAVQQTATPSTPPATATPDSPSSASPTADPTAADAPDDELLAVTLTDVRTGASFTLAELAAAGGPVLVEPMAIWCTSCRAQQHEVAEAHAGGDFTSVSLDVDLSEQPGDLAAYAEREGWDWRFAMADAALYRLLQERFGVAATNPPSTPLIVIEPDYTVRPLDFGVGVRSAEQVLAELGAS